MLPMLLFKLQNQKGPDVHLCILYSLLGWWELKETGGYLSECVYALITAAGKVMWSILTTEV